MKMIQFSVAVVFSCIISFFSKTKSELSVKSYEITYHDLTILNIAKDIFVSSTTSNLLKCVHSCHSHNCSYSLYTEWLCQEFLGQINVTEKPDVVGTVALIRQSQDLTDVTKATTSTTTSTSTSTTRSSTTTSTTPLPTTTSTTTSSTTTSTTSLPTTTSTTTTVTSTASSNEGYYTLVLNDIMWRRFWWFKNMTVWPSGETDVLNDEYGTCNPGSNYCFGRLPSDLQETGAELLAKDSAGTVYRWVFDAGNPTAHAAWQAFHDHVEFSAYAVRNSNGWDPEAIEGLLPARTQDSFMYREQYDVKSVLLDDDNCDCHSTISLGHGMCFSSSSHGNDNRFGVDYLKDITCDVPTADKELELFFRAKSMTSLTSPTSS